MTAVATAAVADLSDPPARRPSERVRRSIGLAALVAVALPAYGFRLGTRSWFVDEAVYVEAGRAYVDGRWELNREAPPLAKYAIGLGDRVFGAGPTSDRIVPALVGLALVAAVFELGRRLVGFWAGLLAAGLYAAVPHPLRLAGYLIIPDRIDRHALLDPMAALLALAALAAGWRWASRASWGWAVATGALVGAAAGAKLPGGLVAPVIVGLVLVTGHDRRRLAQVVVVALAAVATLALAYAPFGSVADDAIREGIDYQRGHAASGHLVKLAGEVRNEAPWWAHLWYHWESDGPLVLAGLAVGVSAAWSGAVPRRIAGYLTAAVVVPFAGLATSPIALPHYRMIWLPQLFLLAGLGLHGWLTGPRAPGRRLLAGLALASLGAAATVGAVRLATAEVGDYRLAADRLVAAGVAAGPVVVAGYPHVVDAYLPDVEVRGSAGGAVDGRPVAVIVDPVVADRMPFPVLVASVRDLGYARVRVDRLTVWVDPSRIDPSAVGEPVGR